jgi:hypothetical protein
VSESAHLRSSRLQGIGAPPAQRRIYACTNHWSHAPTLTVQQFQTNPLWVENLLKVRGGSALLYSNHHLIKVVSSLDARMHINLEIIRFSVVARGAGLGGDCTGTGIE